MLAKHCKTCFCFAKSTTVWSVTCNCSKIWWMQCSRAIKQKTCIWFAQSISVKWRTRAHQAVYLTLSVWHPGGSQWQENGNCLWLIELIDAILKRFELTDLSKSRVCFHPFGKFKNLLFLHAKMLIEFVHVDVVSWTIFEGIFVNGFVDLLSVNMWNRLLRQTLIAVHWGTIVCKDLKELHGVDSWRNMALNRMVGRQFSASVCT